MCRAILPNLFTIGNLFCGFVAIHYILQGKMIPAAWLILLGAALDKMDGFIARLVGKDSAFGIEFDSLVDICTFGIGPALMIYLSYLNTGWGLIIAFVYLLCGALRLARFNTVSHEHMDDEKSDFYMGLPIPMAAICLTQYVAFAERSFASPHTVPLAVSLVLLLSFVMLSRFDYDTMPNFRANSPRDRLKQIYFLGLVTLMIHPRTQDYFFVLIMIYILIGLYRRVVSVFRDEVTQHA